MNFGHKIALTYGLFVVFMISIVTFCVMQKDITLVSKDYYKKEIAYQEEIDKVANTAKLSAPILVSNTAGVLNIDFPKELKLSEGEIHFYRPSNANLDFKVPFSLKDSTLVQIPTQKLAKGQWVLKMEWQKAGELFLKEQKIIL